MTIEEHVPLAPYTTFGIGGPAEYFVMVASVDDLRAAIVWAKERDLPVTVLAGGSNVLVADAGVRGLVVHLALQGIASHEEDDAVLLIAGAGETFDAVVAHTVARGWWGLENLSCIPGSVGATPVQNVGAYGVEIADVLDSVEVYDTEDDAVSTFTSTMCAFGYRDSHFKHVDGKRYIITRVTYRLTRTPTPRLHYRDLADWERARREAGAQDVAPTLEEIRAAVCAIRSRKFPDWTRMGTAGSFFKNPTVDAATFARLRAQYPELPGHPATPAGDAPEESKEGAVKLSLGWIIEHVLGARGERAGAVGTYEGQALVLVNHGGATAAAVDAFADDLARRVRDALGIEIEREVTHVS